MCRTGCRTQDHETWGECLRAARLRVTWASEHKNLDATRDKRWNAEMDLFRSAVDQGLEPHGTSTAATRYAIEQSDKYGAAYGKDFKMIPSGMGGMRPIFQKDIDTLNSECGNSTDDMNTIMDTARTKIQEKAS